MTKILLILATLLVSGSAQVQADEILVKPLDKPVAKQLMPIENINIQQKNEIAVVKREELNQLMRLEYVPKQPIYAAIDGPGKEFPKHFFEQPKTLEYATAIQAPKAKREAIKAMDDVREHYARYIGKDREKYKKVEPKPTPAKPKKIIQPLIPIVNPNKPVKPQPDLVYYKAPKRDVGGVINVRVEMKSELIEE